MVGFTGYSPPCGYPDGKPFVLMEADFFQFIAPILGALATPAGAAVATAGLGYLGQRQAAQTQRQAARDQRRAMERAEAQSQQAYRDSLARGGTGRGSGDFMTRLGQVQNGLKPLTGL